MSNPFYLFMHIPKTAGTTLRSILDYQYGPENVLTYYNQNSSQLLDNLDASLCVGQNDYRALIGHFQYGVHAQLTQPSKYITFLRDPVKRAISSYYENVKIMSPAVLDRDGNLMGLGTCLREREEFFSNQQLKMFIAKGAMDPVGKSDLEIAQKNMERDFIFSGISEYFDASILLLSRLIGWNPCAYGTLNARPTQERLEAEDLSTLRRINHLENILYQDALDNLLRNIRCAGKSFDSALTELSNTTSEAAKREIQAAQPLPDDCFAINDFLNLAKIS